MKHLFFDLDRTLWDFETNSRNALEIIFDDLQLGKLTGTFDHFHKKYKKINAELWYEYGQGRLSKEKLRVKRFRDTLLKFEVDNKELAETIGEQYVSISPHQTILFPNTHTTLEELKTDGFELHIITNGFKEVQFIKLKKSGIIDFFDIILCSEEVGKNKPAKDVFHSAMERAGAKPNESVMIGDDYKVDVVGAERAGMSGILFDPHAKYKQGTHDWHIFELNQIPETIPWIAKTKI